MFGFIHHFPYNSNKNLVEPTLRQYLIHTIAICETTEGKYEQHLALSQIDLYVKDLEARINPIHHNYRQRKKTWS